MAMRKVTRMLFEEEDDDMVREVVYHPKIKTTHYILPVVLFTH